jgi:hypothetical protein
LNSKECYQLLQQRDENRVEDTHLVVIVCRPFVNNIIPFDQILVLISFFDSATLDVVVGVVRQTALSKQCQAFSLYVDHYLEIHIAYAQLPKHK